ncbi:MAG: peptidyl-prolyl cis-trans isomerase [Thermodesulfovibrionales bacterium]|nr:peptidyl-prolyl cis-trans isomerase [Thermodesulfovibrionales bacterium]
MKRFLVLVLVLGLLVFACKKADMSSDYVVKIDNQRLTEKDLKKEFETLPDMAKQFFTGSDGPERFADELVKREILYLEAQHRGLDKKEDFIKKVEEFKKITLINQLLEEEMKKVGKPTDEELKEYYEKHKDEFTTPNQVRLSQIVVKDEQSARKVMERLQKGDEFSKVAQEMSTDKNTAKSGGDMGVFKKGDLNKDLENIAFRMKKGEISNPIPLKDGIHFLKVTDTKGTVAEFDKVKGFITQKATVEKQRTVFDKLIEDMKKKYKIEINKDALAKVNLFGQTQKIEEQKPKTEQKTEPKQTK